MKPKTAITSAFLTFGIWCVTCALPFPLNAQEEPSERADNTRDPQTERSADPDPDAPVLTAPSILSLDEISLGDDEEAPESVTVRITIDVEGRATVDTCDAGAFCTRVEEVITRARFAPATRDGEPIPARIQVRLTTAREEPEDEPVDETPAESTTAPSTDPSGEASGEAAPSSGATAVEPSQEEEEIVYGAEATVEQIAGRPRRLELAEMRSLPGASGDPFRAIEIMPGVLQAISGLPFVYVRGAPPSGTTYHYDGVQLPALYHLSFGPAVVHPTMVGPIQLHSGVAPARYGRAIGGVVVGEGPERPDELTGEVELRAIDIQGAVHTPLGDGSLSVAGRYGYPGLLLSLVVPELDLAYWDYQLRFDQNVGRGARLELVALGSFDRFGVNQEDDDEGIDGGTALTLQFHRFEARVVQDYARGEFGAALRAGTQESTLGEFLTLRLATIAPRVHVTYRRGKWSLRAGADFEASAGVVDDVFGVFSSDGRELDGRYDQSVAGVYLETAYRSARFDVELGARGDVYIAKDNSGELIEGSMDPRLRFAYRPLENLTLHAAAGMAHQPAVAPIPLPGLSQILVSPGLQRAFQMEIGAELEVATLTMSAQGFVHRMHNVLAPDLVLTQPCPFVLPGCDELTVRRDRLWSYGMEFFLKRDPSEVVSGFLSYTIARATIDEREGTYTSTPNFDVRHVLNAVLQVQVQSGWFIGGRALVQSGAPAVAGFVVNDPAGESVTRAEARLPLFYRFDVSAGKVWRPKWGELRLTLEMLNVTLRRQPNQLNCRLGQAECEVNFLPAVYLPNLSLRASF